VNTCRKLETSLKISVKESELVTVIFIKNSSARCNTHLDFDMCATNDVLTKHQPELMFLYYFVDLSRRKL